MPERTLKIYGVLDIAFGLVYLLSFIYVVPPYSGSVTVSVYGLSVLLIGAGILMVSTKKPGYWAGVVAGGGLLLTCLVLLGLLTASAAYLYGLYGAFGKGAAYVTFFVMSLVVTWFGILPCFQLWGLLRSPVRNWALSLNKTKNSASKRPGSGKAKELKKKAGNDKAAE